tara:strand:+ start:2441 stop:2635 length:195 start_codon:yes stop_codon:yes gene_type:complete
MSKYPDFEKELTEITDEEQEKEEDIFPLIDYEDKEEEISNEDAIEKLYRHVREKIISIIRSRIK